MDEILTIPEVASYLKLSKAKLYYMVKRQQIPHFRIGERNVRIRKTDLEKWIEANCIGISFPDRQTSFFHVFG